MNEDDATRRRRRERMLMRVALEAANPERVARGSLGWGGPTVVFILVFALALLLVFGR